MSKSYDLTKLRTVHLVPLTAFDSRDRVDLEVQARHIERLAKAGIRMFMPAAGTGEFHSLSADEIVQVVRVTREAAGPDAQIFAPVGLQVAHAIDVGRRSLAAGANGVMFMPFTHPYLCNTGVAEYYRTVIEALRCPTLIYKKSAVPSDALLLELAENPHVVGIKYAENNLHDFRKVVLADRGRIEWLCGSAERFAPYFMLAGSTGYTTGAGNLAPHVTLAMHAAFAAGAWQEGMRYQQALLPLEEYRAREQDSYNISMLKWAVRRTGLNFGPTRPPQRSLTPADQQAIDRLTDELLQIEQQLAEEARQLGLVRG
jgi:4-hydroxy-tetrahydrodipicolinate synthase